MTKIIFSVHLDRNPYMRGSFGSLPVCWATQERRDRTSAPIPCRIGKLKSPEDGRQPRQIHRLRRCRTGHGVFFCVVVVLSSDPSTAKCVSRSKSTTSIFSTAEADNFGHATNYSRSLWAFDWCRRFSVGAAPLASRFRHSREPRGCRALVTVSRNTCGCKE